MLLRVIISRKLAAILIFTAFSFKSDLLAWDAKNIPAACRQCEEYEDLQPKWMEAKAKAEASKENAERYEKEALPEARRLFEKAKQDLIRSLGEEEQAHRKAAAPVGPPLQDPDDIGIKAEWDVLHGEDSALGKKLSSEERRCVQAQLDSRKECKKLKASNSTRRVSALGNWITIMKSQIQGCTENNCSLGPNPNPKYTLYVLEQDSKAHAQCAGICNNRKSGKERNDCLENRVPDLRCHPKPMEEQGYSDRPKMYEKTLKISIAHINQTKQELEKQKREYQQNNSTAKGLEGQVESARRSADSLMVKDFCKVGVQDFSVEAVRLKEQTEALLVKARALTQPRLKPVIGQPRR